MRKTYRVSRYTLERLGKRSKSWTGVEPVDECNEARVANQKGCKKCPNQFPRIVGDGGA